MRLTPLRTILLLVVAFLFAVTLAPSAAQAGGLVATPSSGLLGTTFHFTGTGFSPNESVALWINNPDGSVTGQGNTSADSGGAVSFDVTPMTGWQYGTYVQVAHGLSSQYEATGSFGFNAPPGGPNSSGGLHAGGCAGGQFTASGFVPYETVATWTTRPDDVTLPLPNAFADEQGIVRFLFAPQPGWPGGAYVVVASGYTSKYQAVNTFYWDGSNVTGGAGCGGSSPLGGPVPAGAPAPVSLTPGNIVNPQGNAVYLNTNPSALYYADCNWKAIPFGVGSTIYFEVLGFTPGEAVSYSSIDIATNVANTSGNISADASGNASLALNTLGWPGGENHIWFVGQSSHYSYCGHFEIVGP
jgi:hypothetical protein